jgi:hypothetical protein
MLTILVFEIKEGKNAQKKKIINNNLSLLSGDISPLPPACMLKKALDTILYVLL